MRLPMQLACALVNGFRTCCRDLLHVAVRAARFTVLRYNHVLPYLALDLFILLHQLALSFGSIPEYDPKIRNHLFRGPQGRAIARSTPFHA